jgi:putative flavoprotein involved in K+ transport
MTTTSIDPHRPDAIIIGAGQAGLATAALLAGRGLSCTVLEESARVGDQWRRRYDSLRLNTPARWDGLPGMPFPAAPDAWPTGRDMGDYLEAYAQAMDLTVRTGTTVLRVDRAEDGGWIVTCRGARYSTRNVVVATGGEHHPKKPDFASQLDPGIRQLHSSEYHNPAQLLPGPVLVVGASQSGADLALEAATTGHETWLSGQVKAEIPFDIANPRAARAVGPILWFMANHVLTMRTPIGRRMQPKVRAGGAPLVRVKRTHLDAAGVHRVEARTVGVHDGRPLLADGQVLDVVNVLWCTGFRQDFGFIHPPVTDESGWPRDDGGVVPSAPGLYFVGLLFQRGFYSMLIGGAGRDAAHIAGHIAARERARLAGRSAEAALR